MKRVEERILAYEVEGQGIYNEARQLEVQLAQSQSEVFRLVQELEKLKTLICAPQRLSSSFEQS